MDHPAAIDESVALSTLLPKAELRELIHELADAHGASLLVVDAGGAVLAADGNLGGCADLAEAMAAGAQAASICLDGEELGKVAARAAGAGALASDRLASLAASIIGILSHGANARRLMSEVHVAAMEESHQQLETRNAQLERAMGKMQEVDRLKSGFLATMSHELRTPLTSVIGYSEMLIEGLAGPVNEEQRDYLSTVLSKADQLLQIISGLLDASMMETGAATIARVPVNLEELVAGVVETFRGQAEKRGVELVCSFDGVPSVLGESRKLRQVVWHLVSNAVKFTSAGGRVDVTLSRTDLASPAPSIGRDALGVVLVVKDTGIGISAEKVAHIFEPFFQVDSSSTREYGGTGLGLTLAKSYVEAHGGRISVDSAPKIGSSFQVVLPVASAEEISAASMVVR